MPNFFKDLDALRADPMESILEPEGILTTVSVCKPQKLAFFRVSSNPDHIIEAYVFRDKANNDETYFVAPLMCNILAEEVTLVRIILYITRQNNIGLWEIPLPGTDGRSNNWNTSALAVAKIATTKWVRIQSDREISAYKAFASRIEHPEPVWPTMAFNEILEIAFAGRIIDSEDHPIVRRLNGSV